uniref:Uncharacterized protein n=1 Tax=Gossypium raimondii TaxID=29730 RepID=A0A0D2SRM1_GOSRA|nr:hypothetical protein B456_008G025500 [Gossypium raimondii]
MPSSPSRDIPARSLSIMKSQYQENRTRNTTEQMLQPSKQKPQKQRKFKANLKHNKRRHKTTTHQNLKT